MSAQDLNYHENQERIEKLKDEFNYYLNNQQKLALRYEGQFVVIKNHNVIGNDESIDKAIKETLKKHELGTFITQYCSADVDSTKCNVHSSSMFFQKLY
ncbi:MAG: hypothetical protein OXC61_03100 [Flavobacteriaceae bacterium]|nr:hypothetical protein [Flavobacteriaceae bacterium]